MIDVINVSKAYGKQQVLNDVSFRIGSGERVGIVGPNGTGKSTIFSLLVGDITPDSGTLALPRGCRLGHLRQQIDLSSCADTLLEYAEGGMPELAAIQKQMDRLEHDLAGGISGQAEKNAALEELGELQTQFEDMDGYSLRNRAETALFGLGFTGEDLHRPFKEFSGGWQMRAELVRVIVADPDILLLDEPSNYLDIPAIEWLQRFLREFPGTLALISHDRYLLNSLTSATIEIVNAHATRYAGNYDFYVTDRVKRHDEQLAAYKNQARKREQTERFIERFRAKNTKAAAVQSRIKMLERMETIEIPHQLRGKARIRLPKPVRSGQEVARLEGAGVTYDGERWVLRRVDFRIERGDKIALVGLNGLGKTTLLRVLSGRLAPSEGKCVRGHKVTVGYQSQEFTETLNDQLPVLSAVRGPETTASDREVRTLLGGFGFSGEDVEKTVQVLSGGEKVRLAFAKMLLDPPNFLLLDEPTTHLDIEAREALEGALAEFEGTLCIVSHDIEFVRRVANTIVAMTPPGITGYSGDYDYYLDKIREQAAVAAAPKVSEPSARQKERRKRAETVQQYSKIRRNLKKEIRKVEERIEGFEARREQLLGDLNREGVDYEEVNRGLTRVQQQLNDYTSRWEALAIELDELDREYAEKRKATG